MRRADLTAMSLRELPAEIVSTAHALRGLAATWMIAGGWAIDLQLGRITRPHADVDVAVFRTDQHALHDALPGWRFECVVDGALQPWDRSLTLEMPVHEVHAQPPAPATAQRLEFLLNERDGSDWVYRRDQTVRRRLTRVVRWGPTGLRLLAPEIVLLYKSKSPRATDEEDFRAAQPLLTDESRMWLDQALRRARPDHPWISGTVSRT